MKKSQSKWYNSGWSIQIGLAKYLKEIQNKHNSWLSPKMADLPEYYSLRRNLMIWDKQRSSSIQFHAVYLILKKRSIIYFATQKGIAENTQRKREMKIFWTKEALIRLQEIEDYISRDNPIAAIELVDKLISVPNQ